MSEFTEHYLALPDSVQRLVRHIVEKINPEEIILFGSRARGSHRPNSDFDFVVRKSAHDKTAWARLLVDLDDEPITLHKIDLVLYNELNEEYLKNIQSEGLRIYG